MKLVLCALVLLSALAAQATEVYTYRDENGNVVFSDKPGKNSKKHQVKEIPTMPAFAIPEEKPEEKPAEPAFSYTSLSIVTPRNEDHLQAGYAGNVQVSGVLSPGLRPDDEIVLLDNGKIVGQGRQTHFNLKNLFRGEHQLQMEVRNPEGEVMISSNPVILYVHRASSLNRGG
tara:strand:- start:45266 stop:45784 length:519 start_codon:yes stop_codon:yes gene_type:complete